MGWPWPFYLESAPPCSPSSSLPPPTPPFSAGHTNTATSDLDRTQPGEGDAARSALAALLEPFKSSKLPPKARTDPAIPQKENEPMTIINLWRYLPFLGSTGTLLTKAFFTHHVYGPPKPSWGVELTLFTAFLREVSSYSHLSSLTRLRAVLDLGSLLPVPKDGIVTPISFRVKRRGLRGFLAEPDAAENGRRVLTGEWVVNKRLWKKMQAEFQANKTVKKDAVIYYLHGGAYYVMSAGTHRFITISLSRYTESRVFALNYRLAPETRFPGQLHDAVSGYMRLIIDLKIPPENIVFAGDSAGGGLCLALMMYLRDEGYPLPSGCVLMSPWVDLTMSCESWTTNRPYDYLPSVNADDHLHPVKCLLGDKIHRYLTHPYVSPLFGDFSNLPPLLIQAGDAEVLRDEITLLAHKASLAGVPVEHELFEDSIHVFQMFFFLEASRKAFQRQRQFIKYKLPSIHKLRAVQSADMDREITSDAHVIDAKGNAEPTSLPSSPVAERSELLSEEDLEALAEKRVEYDEEEEMDEERLSESDSGASLGGPLTPEDVPMMEMFAEAAPSSSTLPVTALPTPSRILRAYASTRDLLMTKTPSANDVPSHPPPEQEERRHRRASTVSMRIESKEDTSTQGHHSLHARSSSHPDFRLLLEEYSRTGPSNDTKVFYAQVVGSMEQASSRSRAGSHYLFSYTRLGYLASLVSASYPRLLLVVLDLPSQSKRARSAVADRSEPRHNVAKAIYCADPDAVDYCVKLCSDVGVSGIGVRIGAYMQAIAFFALTLLVPDEEGAESVWVGLSVSYALLVTAFVQLWQGTITSQHCVVVFLLSMLPYLGSLAAMNSLAAYKGLGPLGLRMLQICLLVKSLLASILWSLILYSFFVGEPPEWLHLSFRQPACFESTALVVFFAAVRPSDEDKVYSHGMVIFYTIVWALLLILGAYWTLRAPIFLKRYGYEWDNEKHKMLQKKAGFLIDENGRAVTDVPGAPQSAADRRALLRKDPEAFTPQSPDEEEWMAWHSLPKHHLRRESHEMRSLPSDTPAPRSSGPAALASDSTSSPQKRQMHQFFIWPVVAVFLTLNIGTTELQIGLNNIFEGEMEFDFPGTLSMLLALPTVWAVCKAVRHIVQGRRPPLSGEILARETLYENGKSEGSASTRSARRRSRRGKQMEAFSEDSEDESSEDGYKGPGRRTACGWMPTSDELPPHAYPPFSMPSSRLDDDGPRPGVPFSLSFFLFGLVNNVLYVVILSAALDLVDKQSTPKGVILLANILPALLVKVGWPYFVRGEVRYARRVLGCSTISFIGILVVALSPSLFYRLLGISIASFSSGLGEMTYLQLATVYGSLEWPIDLGGVAVGWFSSGTGAAGLVGAALWWLLRGLGVREGLLICSFLPLCMGLTYYFLLPPLSKFVSIFQAYDSLPVFDIDDSEEDDEEEREREVASHISDEVNSVHLSTKEKFELAKPLVVKYMLPLFFVYMAEYTINSGVSPTLVYAIPDASTAPLLAMIIHSLRDYYPLWQLVYQTFVFFSRSSLSIFHLPPLPRHLLPLPTILQLGILAITSLEGSTNFLVASFGENGAIRIVFLLIALEGLCGGSAYVNVFYRLGVDGDPEDDDEESGGGGPRKDKLRREKEREFRIASVGFADTLGIVCASWKEL
ncbi:esterase / lipase [Pseudohyphozyma bogoriensis]|nr:esterase / lipase [Pseudohyphozyma bogoriensis]